MDVTLVFVRHSKSCANHVRHVAGTEDRTDPLVAASQRIRDPALSAVGEHMASLYGPQLQQKLITHAASHDVALIGSSPLRRAKQTARLLFGVDRPHTFAFFGEKGDIPENTAEGFAYTKPNWPAFLRTVHARLLIDDTGRRTVITVGHGSFLRTTVWPAISGNPFKGRVHNLDAFVVRGRFNCEGVFTPDRSSATYIPYTGAVKPTAADSCALPTKITTDNRMTRYTRRSRRATRASRFTHRGGYVGMPLAYFKDGAQMQGTTTDPTGVGIGGSSASWAREPIQQSGGSVKRKARVTVKKRKARVTAKRQAGGFSPSVMGSFVSNGLRLVPAVAYVGYNMYKNSRKTRHRGRRTRRN